MNCKNCRHWAANVEMDEFDREAAASAGPSNPVSAWPCTHPKVGGDYNDEAHKSDDSANCYEEFITGPLFGCIHFEATP